MNEMQQATTKGLRREIAVTVSGSIVKREKKEVPILLVLRSDFSFSGYREKQKLDNGKNQIFDLKGI